MIEFYKEVILKLELNKTIAIATVIEHSGSTPRGMGSKMGIMKDGSIFGTIGGGFLEADSIQKGTELIEESKKDNNNSNKNSKF